MFSPSFTGTIIICFFLLNFKLLFIKFSLRSPIARKAGAKLIHFYETTKFFANFFTKRHPLPPISFFHFMEWGIPPNPNCPFRKGLTFFRNPPSPWPKGAPPLPIAPPLREGAKLGSAEAASPSQCFGIAERRDDLVYLLRYETWSA